MGFASSTSGIPPWVDYVAGLSATAAVLLSTTVILREWLSRRREQASRISAWATEVRPLRTETDQGASIQGDIGQQSVRILARNASDAPVYDFQAWVHHSYSPESGRMASQDRHILPPGETQIWVDLVELPEAGLAEMPYVDLTFKDERGRRWQRRYDGGLGRDRITRLSRRVAKRRKRQRK